MDPTICPESESATMNPKTCSDSKFESITMNPTSCSETKSVTINPTSCPEHETPSTTVNSKTCRVIKSQHRACLMKTVAPEHFEELVISHISRRLELGNDKLDELINGVSKNKASIRSRTKASLKRFTSPFHGTKNNKDTSGSLEASRKTVTAVSLLIKSLERECELKVQGLFRISGQLSRMSELQQKLLEDSSIDLSTYMTHDRATVLKNLLRDLPEPLLLAKHFEAFNQAIALTTNGIESAGQRCLRVMQLLMLHLPQTNVDIFQRLLPLLGAVAKEKANKMDSAALAMVFTPHLLCSKQLQENAVLFNSCIVQATAAVKFMIDNSSRIFHIPVEFSRDVEKFLEVECNMPIDARQPCTPVRTVYEDSPVHTSLTFSARSEASRDMTEHELAKLQAHIQSLPERQKRKLSKQLNDVTVMVAADPSTPSGSAGTPGKHQDTPRKHFRSKSLGTSIRKRLPIFKNKSKHPAAALDLGGTMTVVNIDIEDASSDSTSVANGQPGSRKSIKRRADSPRPFSSALPSCLPSAVVGVDVTPPKVMHKEPKEDAPVASALDAKNEKQSAPLPSTENEMGYIPAPPLHERVLQRARSPAKCSGSVDSFTIGAQSSPQGRRSRSRERQCLQFESTTCSPIRVESSV
ncbi:rho GTPase-activating protein 19-like [Babylonia areolata]|uniref:rho GTPase-activating protein 19-like n=1 Tax=Babylonia areolata TaxID=304850 RepID=UPI003FD55496